MSMEFYRIVQMDHLGNEIEHIAHFSDILEWKIDNTMKIYCPILRGGKMMLCMMSKEGAEEVFENWKKYKIYASIQM